jgi:hypothetical protein
MKQFWVMRDPCRLVLADNVQGVTRWGPMWVQKKTALVIPAWHLAHN